MREAPQPTMSGSWIRCAVRPSSAPAAVLVSAAMFNAGAQGVHEDGEWLVTHFEPGSDTSSFLAAVRDADGRSVIESGAVVSVDWSVAWRDRMVSHPVGRLTIAPPWLAGSSDPSTTVIIDPGMAFGTGDHATTRGVVRLMQQVIRAGDVVADLGTGSGVLAIAAAKLGASRVAAIEIDPDAITNAEENVMRNDVAGQVTVLEGDAHILLTLVAPVRVVLANIVSSVLLALLPLLEASLERQGVAIVSGILESERSRMLSHLGRRGWRILAEDHEDVWWSACVGR